MDCRDRRGHSPFAFPSFLQFLFATFSFFPLSPTRCVSPFHNFPLLSSSRKRLAHSECPHRTLACPISRFSALTNAFTIRRLSTLCLPPTRQMCDDRFAKMIHVSFSFHCSSLCAAPMSSARRPTGGWGSFDIATRRILLLPQDVFICVAAPLSSLRPRRYYR